MIIFSRKLFLLRYFPSFVITFILFYGFSLKAVSDNNPDQNHPASIISLVSDGTIPFMLDNNGDVWAFSKPFSLENPVKFPHLRHIKKIAPNTALTEDGHVYIWTLSRKTKWNSAEEMDAIYTAYSASQVINAANSYKGIRRMTQVEAVERGRALRNEIDQKWNELSKEKMKPQFPIDDIVTKYITYETSFADAEIILQAGKLNPIFIKEPSPNLVKNDPCLFSSIDLPSAPFTKSEAYISIYPNGHGDFGTKIEKIEAYISFAGV